MFRDLFEGTSKKIKTMRIEPRTENNVAQDTTQEAAVLQSVGNLLTGFRRSSGLVLKST